MSATSDIAQLKKTLRDEARRKRSDFVASIQGGDWRRLWWSLLTHFDDVLAKAAKQRPLVIGSYFPVKDETETGGMIERSLEADDCTIALPVPVGADKPLIFRKFPFRSDLVPGPFGIPVPPDDQPELEPDVVIVPLLAFDRLGLRLGYGGGYYDRTLRALRAKRRIVAVGLAYAVQEMASIPFEPQDERLDWIVTEDEAIETVKGRA